MQWLDYAVLTAYLAGMAVIGYVCMWRIKHQEDFFLGGRSFGKLMQAFAAFGAGTGADNPVTLGRTVWTSGLSGIWSVLLWLFVTPFYWIYGVWYRRMRHLTLGDFFAERYQSRGLGALYAVFGFCFYTWYLSVPFSAVSKVCEALLGFDTVPHPFGPGDLEIKWIVVPVIAGVVVLYGVMGGLRAAYWTDLIQGIFILFLSVMIIPFGLWQLVEKFGDPETMGLMDGFRIMHENVSEEYFELIESPRGGEFPLYYIAAITLINLLGIVVQPHFIATGGGAAKSETAARVGLVVGNFMKRLCTVGWALTALIALALLAGDVDIAADPDHVWGYASLKILGPLELGLVGLMLACLLAALMSSADCYMLVSSGLFVRNLYAAFVKPQASERHYVLVGRIVSFLMITGSVLISISFMDVFGQLKITWELTMIFASVFWVGMFWRRATRAAAWMTALFSAAVFFVIPILLPELWPALRENQRFTGASDVRTTTITLTAAPADVARREAEIQSWMRRAGEIEKETDLKKRAEGLAALGERPAPLELGERTTQTYRTGGKAIYWRSGVKPVGSEKLIEVSRETKGSVEIVTSRYADDCRLSGEGFFNLDFFLYDFMGLDLSSYPDPALETLRFPPKIIAPFLLMILLSLVTRRGRRQDLDRFYVKMKTPTHPDREADERELYRSYENPSRFDHKKLFPGTELEFQKPDMVDIVGFIVSFGGTFAIIWLAVWVAKIGS